METQVRTPQAVFMQPQRLVVPLFQRPYVWNQDEQWEPLWDDVVRVADRLLSRPQDKQSPHFLGAVVLQQVQGPTGLMQQRTIIDGQQRLTTLQLLLDALHAELLAAGALPPAMRIDPLVTNLEPFRAKAEERFKVWPTNRDRPAFNAVMGAAPPVDYDKVGFRGERMVKAHQFFSEQARQWLSSEGVDKVEARAIAIETVIRELLQMVVIDLGPDENAQEIFETLNARGAPLTAADLIKNFIFQRLFESGADVEAAYERSWRDFESGFWEAEVGAGRVRHQRSSIFLNHWLIARTGEEVVAREVFDRFKRFAILEAGLPMAPLLGQIHDAAGVYQQFITTAAGSGPINRLGLFGYRTSVLESEVIKPLVLWLLDPGQQGIGDAQFSKVLDVVESWMVRRMLVRATTKSYTQVVAELIAELRKSDRSKSGDVVEGFLAAQRSASRYWPDDQELLGELRELLAYRRLGRGRLRMVLEAIEDHCRGWKDGNAGLGNERVARSKHSIEHVMPRKWVAHWSQPAGTQGDTDRDQLIHTLGNLTLLTGKLNAKVSNGPWLGAGGKREGLEKHDVLFLNRELLKESKGGWTDEQIRARTDELARIVVQIWPVPEGHRSEFSREKARPRHRVDLLDLINAGALQPGVSLFPRGKGLTHRAATLLPDGRIEIENATFDTPSAAAAYLTGKGGRNGWWFFFVDVASRRTLKKVWREYVDTLARDVDDEEDGEDEGDEDDA